MTSVTFYTMCTHRHTHFSAQVQCDRKAQSGWASGGLCGNPVPTVWLGCCLAYVLFPRFVKEDGGTINTYYRCTYRTQHRMQHNREN